MEKNISIVMPCSNKLESLKVTLESLCKQTFPFDQFEVIVVDQVSKDGSREYVRSLQTPYDLRLLEQDGLYGISVSRNKGLAIASSDIVLFLDADLVAHPDLVKSQFECQSIHFESIVCGRVLSYPPAYLNYYERIANPEGGLDRGESEQQIPFYRAFGGHLSLSKDTYHRIGEYDPGFRRFQDIEFAYRASRLGIPIIYNPKAISYHNHPRTLQQRIDYAKNNSMIPVLLARYPELKGTINDLWFYEPVEWRRDSLPQIVKKLTIQFYALPPVLWFFKNILLLLDRFETCPRLTRFVFWRLETGYGRVGYRNGAKMVANGQISSPTYPVQ